MKFDECNLNSQSGDLIGQFLGKLHVIKDLEICIPWNKKFKDEGVKNLVKGIPNHNNLKKLHLNFSDCGLSHKSGVFIG